MTELEPEPPPTARGKVAAIFVILALLGCGFWLMNRLGAASAVQDCVATGHRDCGQAGSSNP